MNYEKIISIIDFFREKNQDYNVWVVANVVNTVQTYESFIKHTNFSEFFTKAEFASILSAITELFGYVRVFYSEIEFISYVLDKKDILETKNLLVYNFTRDGVHEGKKSLIPAFCDLFEIHYIGSNPFVISLLRNKFVYSQYLNKMGIRVPLTVKYIHGKDFFSNPFIENCPLIIKNVFESASIGMSEQNIITTWSFADIQSKLDKLCLQLQTNEILMQNYIAGIECEVFVIKYQNQYHAFHPVKIALNASDIITSSISDAYDYSFSPLSEEYPENFCNQIMSSSEKAAELLNISCYARFDYRININGEFFLFDIAGTPYLTRHTSIAYLFTNILNLKYSDIFAFLAAIADSNYSQDVNCKSDNGNPLEQ